jgi:hypothetical protein
VRTLPFFLLSIRFTALSLGLGLIYPSSSLAGKITKNQQGQVVVQFDSDEPLPKTNQRYYVLDQSSHKEIGIITITKTKDARALGQLLKGKAKPGDTTDLAKSSRKGSDDDREPAETNSVRTSRKSPRESGRRSNIGVGLDLVYTSFYLVIPDSTALPGGGEGAISGTGVGVRGYFDYAFSRSGIRGLSLLASGGIHPVNAKSTEASYPFEVNVNCLRLGAQVRYSLENRRQGLWLAGGLGLLAPTSSTKDLDSTAIGDLSAGYNIRAGKGFIALKGDLIILPEPSGSYQMALGGAYFF